MDNNRSLLRYSFAIIFLSLFLHANAQSQETFDTSLKEGDKIRVYSREHTYKMVVGTYIKIIKDSLYMKSEYSRFSKKRTSSFHSYQISSVDSLQVSAGKENRMAEYASGFGLAFFLLGVFKGSEGNDQDEMTYARYFLSGFTLGLVVGWGQEHDKWEKVPLENLKLSLNYSPEKNNQIGLAFSMHF